MDHWRYFGIESDILNILAQTTDCQLSLLINNSQHKSFVIATSEAKSKRSGAMIRSASVECDSIDVAMDNAKVILGGSGVRMG